LIISNKKLFEQIREKTRTNHLRIRSGQVYVSRADRFSQKTTPGGLDFFNRFKRFAFGGQVNGV